MTPRELADLFADYVSNGVPEKPPYLHQSHRFYNNDWETTHSVMDELMEEVLRELGYGEAMDIYEATTRWYA